jgi:hypothetical protein
MSARSKVWRKQALAAGVAAREQLRNGVEQALQHLGQGFWEESPELRTRLRDDPLAMRAFFGESAAPRLPPDLPAHCRGAGPAARQRQPRHPQAL